MSDTPDRRHTVRKVVLPSGRTIDVVQVDDAAAPAAPDAGLHVCPCCTSELVEPTEWQEAGPLHWEMSLRCPDCGWIGGGIYHQELVERLEDELDRGTELILRDLRRLVHANMAEQVERFSAALHADAILPEDF